MLRSICRIDAVSQLKGSEMANALLSIIEEESKDEELDEPGTFVDVSGSRRME